MSTFRLGEKIGAGGMATVFLAVQEGPGGFEKHVAFKRLHDWVLNDERVADSFLKEARLAGVLRHPNIVSTLDVGRDGNAAFIVMEYLRGETVSFVLSTMTSQAEAIPVPISCHVVAQVAAALDYAHNLRTPDGRPAPIVHRDVSPSNIIVCYNGMVKLLDFGIATRPDEEGERSEILKGKTDHLAPEQLMGTYGDPRSDVFQLGICLWEMLTSRRLFGGATDAERMKAVLEREIPPPSQFNDDVPPEIDIIVTAALQRDPELRLSASELQERLETAVSVAAGARELRSWMASTFPRREDYWIQIEREVATAPSLTASRANSGMGPPPTATERSLWVMVVGSTLFAMLALAIALFAVVYLDQSGSVPLGIEGSVAPVGLEPLPQAPPAPEVVVPSAPEPEPEPVAPPARTARRVAAPAPVERREEAAAVAAPEAAREIRPRFDASASAGAAAAPEPTPAPEPAIDEAWRIDETDEIIDPFADED
ncbi:MAG: serine/threonine-protein kinase [Myxococcota bacterium]